MEKLDSIREQLITLIDQKKYVVPATPEIPCRWFPHKVMNPKTDMLFTLKGAWIFISEILEDNPDIAEVDLEKPPGKKGYEIVVDLTKNEKLYIKLQLGSKKVIGRSFHYSEK